MKKLKYAFLSCLCATSVFAASSFKTSTLAAPIQQQEINMRDYSNWYFISPAQEELGVANPHNTAHYANYSSNATPYNSYVLRAVDQVMSLRPDGGTYYTGKGESPAGYAIQFNGYSLLTPPRDSSYCSGATYSVFIEALNLINPNYINNFSPAALEALKTQRADGSARPDNELFWGLWNNDFWGIYDAMVNYAGVGEVISPYDAQPGDFMKIQWTASTGHFVVFLGWIKGANGLPVGVRYWSSNQGTNGYGESEHSISSIYALLVVRLSNPDKLSKLNPSQVITPLKVSQAGFVLK